MKYTSESGACNVPNSIFNCTIMVLILNLYIIFSYLCIIILSDFMCIIFFVTLLHKNIHFVKNFLKYFSLKIFSFFLSDWYSNFILLAVSIIFFFADRPARTMQVSIFSFLLFLPEVYLSDSLAPLQFIF